VTLPAPTYDLTLIIDPRIEDDARTKIVADARATIEAQGELLRHDEWGERAFTYPIDRKPNGEYHLLQFHAPQSELLDNLNRTLRITDGLMRFRIIKLKPGVPDAPDMRSTAAAVRRTEPEAAEIHLESVPEDVPAAVAVAEPAA
jgi:small subunit ribosomal protein S6